jgi:hypothetical protein
MTSGWRGHRIVLGTLLITADTLSRNQKGIPLPMIVSLAMGFPNTFSHLGF